MLCKNPDGSLSNKYSKFQEMQKFRTKQGSISSTFYKQFLRAKIPKAQKNSQVKQLFSLLGSVRVKAVRKHVGEISPRSFKTNLLPRQSFRVWHRNAVRTFARTKPDSGRNA